MLQWLPVQSKNNKIITVKSSWNFSIPLNTSQISFSLLFLAQYMCVSCLCVCLCVDERLTMRMSRLGQMRSGRLFFITSSSAIPLKRLCFRRGFFSCHQPAFSNSVPSRSKIIILIMVKTYMQGADSEQFYAYPNRRLDNPFILDVAAPNPVP